MREIGIRELRDHLSQHLTEVREGHSLTITDHGKPVARLVPAGQTTLERLIAEGRVTPARRRKSKSVEPAMTGGPLSDLVDEQRR